MVPYITSCFAFPLLNALSGFYPHLHPSLSPFELIAPLFVPHALA